jgi:hypothetical protein
VEFEFRFADGEYNRLPGLVADLVRRQPAIITALTTIATIAAVRAADGKIPMCSTSVLWRTEIGIAKPRVRTRNPENPSLETGRLWPNPDYAVCPERHG